MRSAFEPTSRFRSAFEPTHVGLRAAGTSPRFDAETGRLFSDLRRYLNQPVQQIARRIAAHPDVIAALEEGRIDRLPPWAETARVAAAYIQLAGLDPRPALDRLSVLMGTVVDTGPSLPGARQPTSAKTRDHHSDGAVSRIMTRLSEAARGRGDRDEPSVLSEFRHQLLFTAAGLASSVHSVKAPFRWVAAAALALILVSSALPSSILQASVGGLSQPISGLWRTLSNGGSEVRVIILENGLKWFDADDPRDRRTDKLPSDRS